MQSLVLNKTTGLQPSLLQHDPDVTQEQYPGRELLCQTLLILGGIPTARYVTEESGSKAITKVMMNPPFALKRSDEKEFRFIDHALDQMEHGC